MAEKNYWQWFCSSLFYAPGLEHKLLEKYGTPERVFHSKEQELTESFPSNQEKLTILAVNRKKWDFNREAERLQRLNLTFLSIEDPRYPKRLGTIPDAPCGLFVRGKLPEEEKPAVAIVGARDCTAYGSNGARWFARELAGAGVQIISGMARGVDGAAHRGALEAGGASFGVLAGGVDICYPREHIGLYVDILEEEGGILSEFPPGTPPAPQNFPRRNRIISGLSDLVLVIEAREKSGS
ncbi:MAG: DNA-processing protein DprA, partial [Lachnospiraceae bacterium]|nr:DNA-processing protein DprA [Lachnospiraceae bacterium]